MLVVKLEFAPGGDKRNAKQIGELRLGREGPAAERNDYVAAIFDERGARRWAGRVEKHRRELGAWALVRAALDHAARETPGGFPGLCDPT